MPRLLALAYLLCLGGLASQVEGLVGSRGISPIAPRLRRMAEDFPGPRRFIEMPTLLWLCPRDAAVRALPLLGALGAALALVGGEFGRPGLALAWLCTLSLDVCALMFPWDCLLLEAGFLALFLPATAPLPALEAAELPLPLVAFAFRFLVARLMWGFAKLKFIGTKPGDALYLHGFTVWMPMPTPLGWWLHHAPHWLLRALLWFMFVVEVVCPGLALLSGPPRVVGALGLVLLMVGIQLTGNWGYFNLGYAFACFALLDTQSSVFDALSVPALLSHGPVNLVMLIYLFGSVLYFPFNSWCTQTFIHWPFDDLTWRRPYLAAIIGFYRALAPLRLVHAYGVFPPHASPQVKLVPVFEGSVDGVTWRAYPYRFMPATERSRPPFVAPFHPRLDQGVIYLSAGMSDADLLSSIMGTGRPYGFSSYSAHGWPQRLMQRLLEGEPSVLRFFAGDPFPGQPPKFVRLSTYALTPCSPREHREAGAWWKRRYVGSLLGPFERDGRAFIDHLPPPELFHPDDVARKRRAPALRAAVDAYRMTADVHGAVCVGSDLTSKECTKFWCEVVPFIAAERADWTRLPARVAAFRARFSAVERLRFERILERYALLLRVRLEPYFYADHVPKIELGSNFRFSLLLHEIVVDGKAELERLLAHPERAAERARRSTDASSLYVLALFRFETVAYHAHCMRQMLRVTEDPNWPIPGIMEMKQFLTDQVPRDAQWLPTCTRLPSGAFRVDGFGDAGEGG